MNDVNLLERDWFHVSLIIIFSDISDFFFDFHMLVIHVLDRLRH
jgi:hypothetical protein